MTPDRLVADIVAAAGGEIVGRIRFQKTIYLLNQKGLDANVAFHYYHYGPYSRVVDSAIEKAKAFHDLTEITKYRSSDGAPFSVFRSSATSSSSSFGAISARDMLSILQRLRKDTSTVLELAATIHWLCFVEKLKDWKSELVRRKGAKTLEGRIDEALALLRDLHLSPM